MNDLYIVDVYLLVLITRYNANTFVQNIFRLIWLTYVHNHASYFSGAQKKEYAHEIIHTFFIKDDARKKL